MTERQFVIDVPEKIALAGLESGHIAS